MFKTQYVHLNDTGDQKISLARHSSFTILFCTYEINDTLKWSWVNYLIIVKSFDVSDQCGREKCKV